MPLILDWKFNLVIRNCLHSSMLRLIKIKAFLLKIRNNEENVIYKSTVLFGCVTVMALYVALFCLADCDGYVCCREEEIFARARTVSGTRSLSQEGLLYLGLHAVCKVEEGQVRHMCSKTRSSVSLTCTLYVMVL